MWICFLFLFLFITYLCICYCYIIVIVTRYCCERINKRIDKIELYFCLIRIIFIVLRVKDEKDADLFRSCVLNIDSWNVNDFFVRAIWNRTKKKKKGKGKRIVPSFILFYFPFLHTVKYVKKSMPLAVNRYYFFEL